MFYSLRWKLLVGFLVIVVLAVGTVTFIATRTTTREFDRFITQDKALKYQGLAILLSSYYEETGSWKGIQKLIRRVKEAYRGRIILANDQGMVIGDTGQTPEPGNVSLGNSMKIATLRVDEESIGFVYLRNRERSPLEKSFLNSVNKSVLLGALIAGIAAAIFTLFYSRQILQPIKALTTASNKIKNGELGQRVRVDRNDEIGELASTFNSMAHQLQTQKELRRNMVNDLAHELRNPLSKSHGYLEALKEGAMQPTEEIIDSLYRHSLLLKRLVNDLQDLAMAESGQLKLSKRPVVLRDLISNAVASLRVKLEENDVELDISAGDEILVQVDPDRIEQVLRNLVDNAIAHIKKEGSISIATEVAEDQVTIIVEDNGKGIPPEDIPHIFDRFYRIDESRARSSGGTGLGLTIAKEIVNAHGGDIEVESEVGEGTTFRFTLPRT